MDARLSKFFELLRADVMVAAPNLLGMHLVRDERRARIVEVEAYRAEDDPASHAYGKTKMKNMAMFGPPGHAYVYFNYGVHWMLNVVAHPEGSAAAILVRAAQPLGGLEEMRSRRPKARSDEDLLSGPGKLAAAFDITGADNGINLLMDCPPKNQLRLEFDAPVRTLLTGPRIGLAIGKAHENPWRFIDGDALRWVSKPRPRHP